MTKYAIERCPNKEYMTVHLSVEVPKIRGWLSSEEPKYAAGEPIKQALESINGIEEASSRGQSVTIKRGGAFTFEELLPDVLEVLREKLGIEKELTEVELYA